jgi:hypothetical protein
VPYVRRYALRNGGRIGGGHHEQLVQPETVDAVTADDERQRLQRVDALYREWSRNRAYVDLLRHLQAAIAECLEGSRPVDRLSGFVAWRGMAGGE